jgi:hypothetical protein
MKPLISQKSKISDSFSQEKPFSDPLTTKYRQEKTPGGIA